MIFFTDEKIINNKVTKKNLLLGVIVTGCYMAYKDRVRKKRKEGLKDQVVVITGASEGIGRAYAKSFAREGAKIVLAARTTDKIEKLAKELSTLYYVDAIAVTTDVSNETDCKNLIDKALENFGHIDILINNAGIASYAYFYDNNLEDMKKMMDINYWGTVYCTYYALPSMMKRKKGRIVNISSVVGKRAMPTMSGYSATKFAMEGLSESLRTEVKKYGIEVSVICPTTTKTELVNNALQKDRLNIANKGMSSERVAKETINAILDNKREYILGLFENIGISINKNFPSIADKVLTVAPKFMSKE